MTNTSCALAVRQRRFVKHHSTAHDDNPCVCVHSQVLETKPVSASTKGWIPWPLLIQERSGVISLVAAKGLTPALSVALFWSRWSCRNHSDKMRYQQPKGSLEQGAFTWNIYLLTRPCTYINGLILLAMKEICWSWERDLSKLRHSHYCLIAHWKKHFVVHVLPSQFSWP